MKVNNIFNENYSTATGMRISILPVFYPDALCIDNNNPGT
jgi:hypothetical protein